MKPFAIVILLVALLFGVFVMANWSAFVAPTTLSFLAFTLNGPLGIILLCAMLLMVVLFVLYVTSMSTSMFMTTRRHGQELRDQRALADKAEASRITEMRAHFDVEFERMRSELRDCSTKLTARADALEQALLGSLNESTNTLTAHMGHIDDKLDRPALPSPG